MIKEKQKLTEPRAQLLTGARVRDTSHENKLLMFPEHNPLGRNSVFNLLGGRAHRNYSN